MDSNSIIPTPGSTLPVGKQFVDFPLDASTGDHQLMLLPDEHELVVNVQTGQYVLVNWDTRYFVTDGVFHGAELPLMLTLLNAWPSYVPLQKLISIVFGDTPAKEVQLGEQKQQYDQVLRLWQQGFQSIRSIMASLDLSFDRTRSLLNEMRSSGLISWGQQEEENAELDLVVVLEDVVRRCNTHLRIVNVVIQKIGNLGYKLSHLEAGEEHGQL